MLLNSTGIIVNCNQEAATLMGLTQQKLIGFELAKFWPKTGPDILEAMHKGNHALGLVPNELTNCYVMVKSISGDISGSTITLFDQNLWKPNEINDQSIDPLTPYYKQIFECSSDGLAVVDHKERVLLMNDTLASQLGVSREELLGTRASGLVENKFSTDSISKEVLSNGKKITRLIKHLKTGKQVLLVGSPIFDKKGEVRLVSINERDLTELLELQSSLQHQKVIINHYRDELAEIQLVELTAKEMVARSPTMVRCLDTASKLARHNSPQILITGESGTGKGLLAKFIHSNSRNAEEPFIHVNCAALPEQLLEAELFGYEKHSSTGSHESKAGIFEVAGKGTIFLDEIGEMPPPLQTKLLTFLDTRSFRRISGHRILSSEVTLIASTNQNLRTLIEKKLFRSDLYFRLSVFTLNVPPLRDRKEDILELAHRELTKLNSLHNDKKELDPRAIELLTHYPFPGNVRELINTLQQAYLLADKPQLGEFLAHILDPPKSSPLENIDADFYKSHHLQEYMAKIERQTLLKALSVSRNTRDMATLLGISQAGVCRKLKKFGLPLPKNHINKENSDNQDSIFLPG
jgi:PAS domain S-box-containing protein